MLKTLAEKLADSIPGKWVLSNDVPDTVNVKGTDYPPATFQTNNGLLTSFGLGTFIDAASKEQAGKIGLFNTPDFLLWAECQSIAMGRDFRLRTYNEYRDRFGFDPIKKWEDLTQDVPTQKALQQLYGTVDKLEWVIGLFAEDPSDGALFGDLMTTMVAVDAFSQALTNPILSVHVFTKETMTTVGLQAVSDTPSLQALVSRNVKGAVKASFNYP